MSETTLIIPSSRAGVEKNELDRLATAAAGARSLAPPAFESRILCQMTTLQAMQSPHMVQRSWDMSRGAPIVPAPKMLLIRTLSAPQPIEVEVTDDMTVGELKAAIAIKISASPRKGLGLRWYGSLLEDQYLLPVRIISLPHSHAPALARVESAAAFTSMRPSVATETRLSH